ncbi:MAG: 2-hydroxy-6-oxo-6-phenylhexa-2,4-dienoate hydrolase [Chloroflexi bacterium HGW-Chloroflexi-7]|nr:MAG: 2-hydroxy-6-oxo-6-phenylhexa-2,4-dienoate hydrolase [Chloroflexi bacterium HGW-Chloroflexi-7]HCS40512.1 2-hydroxy-6-oxo-6-phenylhexa-2,4-dienoate hydrolase [Anaerolineaceae bacterium]
MIFTYRDIPIYYEVIGSGRPLLTIHGWSPDHRLMKGCLEPVFQTLDAPWQRIYFDLPGMGQTPGASWIDGSDAMLEVVLAFIDGVLPGQQFAIAGESYGGYLARGVVKKRPEQVEGMLLICPVADQSTRLEHAPAFQIIEKDEAFVNSLSEEDQKFFTGINVVQTRRVWQKFKEDVIPGLKLADTEFLEKVLSQHVPYSFDVDKLDAPFAKPSLMVMGRQDHVVGYRDQWNLLENFPRASFVVLDKAGHNMQIEQDVVFHALVREWLERM